MVHATTINHGDPIVNTTVVYHHAPMSREDPQMKLRIPAELKQLIEDAAKANGRSMNAEIVARLEATFQQVSEISQAIQSLEKFAERKGVKFSLSIGKDLEDNEEE